MVPCASVTSFMPNNIHAVCMKGLPRRRVRWVRVVSLPTPDDLAAAREIVAAHLEPTPLLGPLKLETLQPTGSVKVRGALAALARTPAGERGVTASAGNHGLGVAWAA